MVECRGCGSDTPADAYFCPKCGLRTIQGEEAGVSTPLDSRASWERDVEFALDNALSMLDEAFRAAKEGLQRVADEVGVELEKAGKSLQPSSIYCPTCGNKNPGDSRFCTGCGASLRE